jgi:alpha-tubulin suppressor-like RCC1 family protein
MWGFGTRPIAALLTSAAFVTAGAALPAAAVAITAAPGSAYVFGDNDAGQLGNTTHNGSSDPNPTPTPLSAPAGSGTITQVALGQHSTLMLTSSGTLYGFGSNSEGELGTTASATPNPTPAAITLPGQSGTITQIAMGVSASLVATSSGQLYSFGDNAYGQLGTTANFGNNDANAPALVKLPGQSGTISRLALGGDSSLVLTSSGQLYGFGYNQYGELGTTTNNGTSIGIDTPTLFTLPGQSGTVTQIAEGFAHSLALTSSGQLYSFGDNSDGQLGNATNDGTGTANPTPTLLTLPGASGNVTHIATGNDVSLAATSSGQLFSFGDNLYGELGIPATSGKSDDVPALVTLPGRSGVVTQINSGEDETLVVMSSGQLYSFGENDYGELGVATNSGTTTANATPALVALPAGITIDTLGIGANAQHSVVVVSGLAITSTALPAGQVGVAYAATPAVSGGAAPLAWTASGVPAGLAIDPTTGAITGTPTTATTSSVVLSVTDGDGDQQSATVPLTIAAAAVKTTPPAPPVITKLSQSHATWREGTKLATIAGKRKPPVGPTFTLSFVEQLPGRKAGRKCVAPGKRNRRARACTRTHAAGTLVLAGVAGRNTIGFQGRLSHSRKLTPGTYRVYVLAAAAAGSSRTISLKFTIAP